jgi:hypothetical protein
MKIMHSTDIIESERRRRDEDLKRVPRSVIDGILEVLFKSKPNLNLVRALDAWILRAAAMGYESWCIYQLQLRKTPEVHDVFFDFLEYAIENRSPQIGIPVLLRIDHPTAHRVPLEPLWQGFSENVDAAFWRDAGWAWSKDPGNHDHRAKYVATGRPVPMVVMLDMLDQSAPKWDPAAWCAEMETSLDFGATLWLVHDEPCWWLHAFERARTLHMGFQRGKLTGYPLCFLTENEAEYYLCIGELIQNQLLGEAESL